MAGLVIQTPSKYLLYRGWVLRWMYIFSVFTIGLASIGALLRTTLPRYWRVWLCASLGFLGYKAFKPFPATRPKSIQELRDKLKTATGDHPIHDCYIEARDGVRLHYQHVGNGDKVIMIANGAGGRLHVFEPLLRHLRDRSMYEEGQFTVITWDYRGLFESGKPENDARCDTTALTCRSTRQRCVDQRLCTGSRSGISQRTLKTSWQRRVSVGSIPLWVGVWACRRKH